MNFGGFAGAREGRVRSMLFQFISVSLELLCKASSVHLTAGGRIGGELGPPGLGDPV